MVLLPGIFLSEILSHSCGVGNGRLEWRLKNVAMKYITILFLVFSFVRSGFSLTLAYPDLDSLQRMSPKIILGFCVESKNSWGKIEHGILYYDHKATFSVVEVFKGEYEEKFVEYTNSRMKIVIPGEMVNAPNLAEKFATQGLNESVKIEAKEYYLLYSFGPIWYCCKINYPGGGVPAEVRKRRERKAEALMKKKDE